MSNSEQTPSSTIKPASEISPETEPTPTSTSVLVVDNERTISNSLSKKLEIYLKEQFKKKLSQQID